MAECKHLVEQRDCADCQVRIRTATPSPDPQADYGPWIDAMYYSPCAECGDQIEPGDRIRADGQGGWLDEKCGSDW